MLTLKQERFVEEFIVDLVGKQAAIRAGYSPKTAEVQASRLLRNAKVQTAVESAMQARSKRTEVSADGVVAELARIAFANIRDLWPRAGEGIDLSVLDRDRTVAVEEVIVVEAVNAAGVVRRRTRLKLHDKMAALTSLARHLGMFADRHVSDRSIEYRVMRMTPEERVACAEQLLENARKYPPAFEEWEAERSRDG